MKRISLVLLSFLGMIACKEQAKENNTAKEATSVQKEEPKEIQLEKIWETDTLLTTAESVLYDKTRDRILVSNGNQGGWKMDGDGFIAEIDFDGNIKTLKLIAGLSSPKGMALIADTLYVADSKEIAKIDLNTKKIIKRYALEDIEDPQFNDIVKKDETLYISACNAKSIYKIENDSLQLAYKGSLSRPNGLLFRNDSLFVMNSKSQDLKVISKNEQLTTLTKDIGAGDGITKLNEEELIVSDWNGQLFYIDQKFNKKLLFDTQKEGFNSADIQYFEDKNLLLVPTFSGNTVAAYRVRE
ncbi:hypothetical protein [Mesonia mobilis]|uniref:hypothetical protein n=1 Tax=Mesonia mobilis TaxID=369791 RepID=UPI0026EC7788|nr:hypothetical protein [Mesonia mobilis]